MMKTHSWRLAGGIDLVRSPIMRHKAPGELIGCMNYEARDEGYRRISGYERFDGRKAPSDIFDDEPGEEDAQAEIRRRVITKVPGEKLLAVWRYRDRTYAFSADAGGVVSMYGSSSTGWQLIDLGWKVAFTAGRNAPIEVGDTVRKGSGRRAPSGTVLGFYLTGDGTWQDGTASGVLVISYASTDRFQAGALDVTVADKNTTLTLAAVPQQQTPGTAEGAQFRFVNHNFFGLGSRERMYGVSGTGRPFEYDGTMFLELETGVTASQPSRIAAHENHLFVGYPEGGIVFSGVGNPRSFSADDGAGEIGIGDTLSELLGGYRNTLFVYGRNRTAFVSGSSATDFVVNELSEEAGAMPNTAVLMDQPTVLDDRGLRNVEATEAFGDFEVGTLSKPIRPLLDFKRDGNTLPVCATRIRRKSQYRVFFADGDCIVMNYVRRRGHLSAEFTRFAYDLFERDYDPEQPDADYGSRVGVLTSVCSVEDSDGRERAFFTVAGSMYVYEMDRGKSFDGHPIPYYLRTAFNDFNGPHIVKRYRKLLLEVDSTFASTFSMAADFDDEEQEGGRGQLHTVIGPTSFWSEGDWSAAYWDQVPTRKAEQRIFGRGRNISVMVYGRPERVEEAHVLSGVTVYYEPRKLQR